MMHTFKTSARPRPTRTRPTAQFRVATADPAAEEVVFSVDGAHPPDASVLLHGHAKHTPKAGCLTCKTRKKRCTGEQPQCSSCLRLGRSCVWASWDMSPATVRQLRRQVLEEENTARRRKLDEREKLLRQPVKQAAGEEPTQTQQAEVSGGRELTTRSTSLRPPSRRDSSARPPILNLDATFDAPYLDLLDMTLPSPTNMLSPYPTELKLDPMGAHLYDHYRHFLAGMMSVVPPEMNHYRTVFLPMAMANPGVLYSILALSAHHIGGEFEAQGSRYTNMALRHINNASLTTQTAFERLATILIMVTTEICKGDVKNWPVFLKWGAQTINDCGGLHKFKRDREQHWLISNFAYHDILASSTGERGTLFPMQEYRTFMNLCPYVDPLQGIVKPLFNMIGEVSTLSIEAKVLLDSSSSSLECGNLAPLDPSPGPSTPSPLTMRNTRYSVLSAVMQRASELELEITNCKPNPDDLKDFSESELELQLTLFECFQLTAKLHIRQSVMKLTPSSLDTQFTLCELLRCLNVVMGSPVEASLCFPLFIAGMNCATDQDKGVVMEYFHALIERCKFKNLVRARCVMEQVWSEDPTGTRCVNWYEIVNRLGWDLSFA